MTGLAKAQVVIEKDPDIDSVVTKRKDELSKKDKPATANPTKPGTTGTGGTGTGTPGTTKPKTPTVACLPYPQNGMVNGYRIQIDRYKTQAEANTKLNTFTRTFPGLSGTVKYEAPNYKVYVGNYTTATAMESDLRRIRKSFPGAFSVRSKVFIDKKIWNAKYCPKS